MVIHVQEKIIHGNSWVIHGNSCSRKILFSCFSSFRPFSEWKIIHGKIIPIYYFKVTKSCDRAETQQERRGVRNYSPSFFGRIGHGLSAVLRWWQGKGFPPTPKAIPRRPSRRRLRVTTGWRSLCCCWCPSYCCRRSCGGRRWFSSVLGVQYNSFSCCCLL